MKRLNEEDENRNHHQPHCYVDEQQNKEVQKNYEPQVLSTYGYMNSFSQQLNFTTKIPTVEPMATNSTSTIITDDIRGVY